MIKAHELKDGEDGIWCPRCGDVFHDADMEKEPGKYYTCPVCFTIEHKECRGLADECSLCKGVDGCEFVGEYLGSVKTLTEEDWEEINRYIKCVFLPFIHGVLHRAENRLKDKKEIV